MRRSRRITRRDLGQAMISFAAASGPAQVAGETGSGPVRARLSRRNGARRRTPARAGHGRVYSEIVPDCSRPTLQGTIRGRVDRSTVINSSDGWRGYNGLVGVGYRR